MTRTEHKHPAGRTCRRCIMNDRVEPAIRFDADVAPHGHFKCVRCGAVYDFGLSSPAALPRPPEAFELMETHLYCRGVCPACRRAR